MKQNSVNMKCKKNTGAHKPLSLQNGWSLFKEKKVKNFG